MQFSVPRTILSSQQVDSNQGSINESNVSSRVPIAPVLFLCSSLLLLHSLRCNFCPDLDSLPSFTYTLNETVFQSTVTQYGRRHTKNANERGLMTTHTNHMMFSVRDTILQYPNWIKTRDLS